MIKIGMNEIITQEKKMKSIYYDDLKNDYVETFIGSFNNLRNNHWIESLNCTLSNKSLKVIEKKVKKGEIFQSVGTLGTKSVFYFDKKLGKFVGFSHFLRFSFHCLSSMIGFSAN